MAGFAAIVKWSAQNKLEKWQPFEVETDADAHVLEHGGFVAPAIGGLQKYWLIDPVAETLTFDQAQYDADVAAEPALLATTELNAPINKTLRDAFWQLIDEGGLAILDPNNGNAAVNTKGKCSAWLKGIRKGYE